METLPAISEQEEKEQQLVQGGITLFQNVPALIEGNKNSLMKARFAVEKLKAKITANGGKLNEELDKEAEQLIVKLKATGTKMKDQRSPVTQIFTAIAKMFTGIEAEMKTVEEELQPLRNDWAKELIAEAERKRKAAEEKAAVETAKAQLKGWIIAKIGEVANAFVFAKKEAWTKAFNAITLETIDAKTAALAKIKTDVVYNDLHDFPAFAYELPYIAKLDAETKTAVQSEAHKEYAFTTWATKASQELKEFKQELADRLPSKRIELEEAEEARLAQVAEAERVRLEAIERQKEIDAAAGAQKKALEAQQKVDAENARIAAENARIAQANAEANRKQREQEAADKLAAEKALADKAALAAGEMATSTAVANTLFEQSMEATPDTPTPEARQGYEIKVLHHSGLAQIFQNWYSNKGIAMTIEDCCKTSINQMIKFAETQAKDGVRIDSKFLKYSEVIKAVNRKEK